MTYGATHSSWPTLMLDGSAMSGLSLSSDGREHLKRRLSSVSVSPRAMRYLSGTSRGGDWGVIEDVHVADDESFAVGEDEVWILKGGIHVVQATPVGVAGEQLGDVLQRFAARAAVPAQYTLRGFTTTFKAFFTMFGWKRREFYIFEGKKEVGKRTGIWSRSTRHTLLQEAACQLRRCRRNTQ